MFSKITKNKKNQSVTFLSGYRLMWVIVLFDLPVVKEVDRKAATKFRNFLLDEGFCMCQFSVYMKLVSGKEVVETYYGRIKKELPQRGKVDIIYITDKQYENIYSFNGREKNEKNKSEYQFLLF
jgi:CRISPR-associated protein Cas2